MRRVIQGDIAMKWIFIDLGVGTVLLLAAQFVEYLVASKGLRGQGSAHIGAFSNDVPPRDTQPATEISAWYDQAA
jgi:hypothetical protein